MVQITVGVRELKTHLSSYLSQVKSGKTLVITERGRPIGFLVPSSEAIREELHQLSKAGFLSWSGKSLQSRKTPVTLKPGGKMASELLLEDRS